jgi:hypothetical protein
LAGEIRLQLDPQPLPSNQTNILEQIRSSLHNFSLENHNFSLYTRKNIINDDIPALINEISYLNTHLQQLQHASLYFAYQIGFYLHKFQSNQNLKAQVKHHFNYSKAYYYFLIRLYELLTDFPKMQHSCKTVKFFMTNMKKINREIVLLNLEEKAFWKES